MKKTLDLLNEVVKMGFNREYALEQIDASLDEIIGFEEREKTELKDEEISDELYEDIIFGFMCELEEC